MNPFERAFHIIIGEEGGFTNAPGDPGNWTGGARGRGICRGTKYGIAASAHPTLDIAALTLAEAQAIYRAAYWTTISADDLPPPLALLVFDAAVNCGPQRAIRWLQTIVKAPATGTVTPATINAVHAIAQKAASEADSAQPALSPEATLCADYMTERLAWMTTLPTWHAFGVGWSRRLCQLPYLSMTMNEPSEGVKS
jgi:lysozyme family protein